MYLLELHVFLLLCILMPSCLFHLALLNFVQTGVALGQELEDKMPVNEYYEYFGPDYTLHVAPSNMENKNTRYELDNIRTKLLDNLSKLRHAPSVQFQERPPDTEFPEVSTCSCIIRRNSTSVSSFVYSNKT